jgi:hypothetical protein
MAEAFNVSDALPRQVKDEQTDSSMDWQTQFLKQEMSEPKTGALTKRVYSPVSKDNTSVTNAAAAAAATELPDQPVTASQTAVLSLAFGRIEYSPSPKNNFYFHKGAPGGAATTLVTLNSREMLELIRQLPEAMMIAHDIEARNEARFERTLARQFPDLEWTGQDDAGLASGDALLSDEEGDEQGTGANSVSEGSTAPAAVSGGNIFSRMIRRHGQNFVSLDVCTYKGLPYIWLKTYFLSRRNPDRPEIVPTRQQFLFSVYDDLEDLFKFYKHCVLLNRSVLEKLKDMATTNLIKFARPMMSTVAAPTAISPEADKTTTEAAAADRADRDE